MSLHTDPWALFRPRGRRSPNHAGEVATTVPRLGTVRDGRYLHKEKGCIQPGDTQRRNIEVKGDWGGSLDLHARRTTLVTWLEQAAYRCPNKDLGASP